MCSGSRAYLCRPAVRQRRQGFLQSRRDLDDTGAIARNRRERVVEEITTTAPRSPTASANSTNRPEAWKYPFCRPTSATMLKMNAPRNVESAFCERSSASTSGKDLGVAVVLAEAYAATMDVTEKMAMTSMLDAMIDSSDSRDAAVMDGVACSRP
jgi:hypothetical protein